MKAEIISVGTELTTGRNLDTNCQWLSRRLAEIGIAVGFHTTVADDRADNVAVLRTAAARAGLVIVTGGLGPTLDDLTREVFAEAAGVELRFHQPSFDAIAGLFARRNRPMPERNRVQAYFPEGAEPIPNEHGTAPGIWMSIHGCRAVALPGVPREMKPMFDAFVRPRLLAAGFGSGVLVEHRINAFGAGESQIESLLGDLTARGRDPEVGITASDAVISLRVVARGADEADARRRIEPTAALILERLGPLVYGTGEDELQDVVMRLLAERRTTVATAESVTAGQVAERLARVAGASRFFRGGVVAYTNEVKAAVLGVPLALLESPGAVSAPVAVAMAEGIRRLVGSDIGLSTTGYAGPPAGDETEPVGTAYIGLATPGGAGSHKVQWFGTRQEVQNRTSKSALDVLRRFFRAP
jgi:nicotinamide-nucleotide amidase